MPLVRRVYHYPITRAMKTYGSIFPAETEGTICPAKESYYTDAVQKNAARRAAIYWQRGLLEACNDLPK